MTSSIIERFKDKYTENPNGCWEWQSSRNKAGYGRFSVGGYARLAHRVAYELFLGDIPKDLCVCHHCDNPCCVNPAHLFIGTHKDNGRDKAMKGRSHHPTGDINGRAKLSEEQIRCIKAELASGVTIVSVSKKYNISYPQMMRIKTGKRWGHISG